MDGSAFREVPGGYEIKSVIGEGSVDAMTIPADHADRSAD